LRAGEIRLRIRLLRRIPVKDVGWSAYWGGVFAPFAAGGLEPGRVMIARRGRFAVATPRGEIDAEPAGRLRQETRDASAWPVTGDWVALSAEGRRIEAVVPRRTCFARRRPGGGGLQALAANIDVAFLVAGLDGDFNLRRLERYLYLARESGARAVVVLNKSDLCDDLVSRLRQCERLAPDVPAVAMSALEGSGVGQLAAYVDVGETAVLLGSSGAGKSTIVNRLRGFESQATRPVREHDSRGRHTTTQRELIALDFGWLLMDVPGIRELQLWAPEAGTGLEATFAEIGDLAALCRFRDCSHEGEPGCAVAEARARGEIDEGRWANYAKMRRELERADRSEDPLAAVEYKRQMRVLHRRGKRFYEDQRRLGLK
jgi:ribosome biogenesis GTPase